MVWQVATCVLLIASAQAKCNDCSTGEDGNTLLQTKASVSMEKPLQEDNLQNKALLQTEANGAVEKDLQDDEETNEEENREDEEEEGEEKAEGEEEEEEEEQQEEEEENEYDEEDEDEEEHEEEQEEVPIAEIQEGSSAIEEEEREISDDDEDDGMVAEEEFNDEDAKSRSLLSRRGVSSSDKKKFLKYQNKIRCMHGLRKFKWSKSLAKNAQKWANRGVTSHSTPWGAFTKYGENMCWGMSISKCVKFWYAEIKNTRGGRLTSANWGASHYSQLVWKRTYYVGCGINKHMGGWSNPLIVCQYSKRGNWAGRCPDCYASNVYGPTKSKSSCR